MFPWWTHTHLSSTANLWGPAGSWRCLKWVDVDFQSLHWFKSAHPWLCACGNNFGADNPPPFSTLWVYIDAPISHTPHLVCPLVKLCPASWHCAAPCCHIKDLMKCSSKLFCWWQKLCKHSSIHDLKQLCVIREALITNWWLALLVSYWLTTIIKKCF